MFCPNCRYEYEPGIVMCPECGVLLVNELPPESEPEYTELVTVLTTKDAGTLVLAKSILEEAGIDYYAKGESTWAMFAAGFIELQVKPEYAEEATRLMEEMKEGAGGLPEEDIDEGEEGEDR